MWSGHPRHFRRGVRDFEVRHFIRGVRQAQHFDLRRRAAAPRTVADGRDAPWYGGFPEAKLKIAMTSAAMRL